MFEENFVLISAFGVAVLCVIGLLVCVLMAVAEYRLNRTRGTWITLARTAAMLFVAGCISLGIVAWVIR